MISGVQIHSLRQIADERGKIMHMLRSDDGHFEAFGEIYFSVAFEGVVKGWHLHKEMILNYACIVGSIKLVLYDDRENSPSKGRIDEFLLGESNYALVRIPPLVWNGFQGVSPGYSMVANCATLPHDPSEIVREDPTWEMIPYDWSKTGG